MVVILRRKFRHLPPRERQCKIIVGEIKAKIYKRSQKCFNGFAKLKHKEASLVNTIIPEITARFIGLLTNFFTGEEVPLLSDTEDFLLREIKKFTLQLIKIYYEHIDEDIRADSKTRKSLGCTVHRIGDKREVITQCGSLQLNRTYYRVKHTGSYQYLLDDLIGLARYERMTGSFAGNLVKASTAMSYQKSCEFVAGGCVTRQTVMNKIRSVQPLALPEMPDKTPLPILHIDADEAHITMVKGKKAQLPLISFYEGVEKLSSSRSACKNIVSFSAFGKKPDDLWEEALTEAEKRYELSQTKVYIHGDGASWIQKGLQWFPNSVFVLDKYHKNRALKIMTAGLGKNERSQYDRMLNHSLQKKEKEVFRSLAKELGYLLPQRQKNICEAARYLLNRIEGICVCEEDVESNGGGSTEPHISHILSSRLSSRPMAWSRKTLVKFAPLLANKCSFRFPERRKNGLEAASLGKSVKKTAKRFKKILCSLGLPMPEAIGRIPAIERGNTRPLQIFLKNVC
jgi:hypothetical protein